MICTRLPTGFPTTSHPSCSHHSNGVRIHVARSHDGCRCSRVAFPLAYPGACSQQSRPRSSPVCHDFPSCSLQIVRPARLQSHLLSHARPLARSGRTEHAGRQRGGLGLGIPGDAGPGLRGRGMTVAGRRRFGDTGLHLVDHRLDSRVGLGLH